MVRVYEVLSKFVSGMEAFYKVKMHVLKVTELWVRASGYMRECDRMCVPPLWQNLCVERIVIWLNPNK